jgi:hypothetical protein
MRVAWQIGVSLLCCCLMLPFPVHAQHLHSAAYRGDLDTVRLLVGRGANVNEKDTSGVAPLHYAAQMGHTDIIELLVSRGADVGTMSTRERNTPLHFASGYGLVEAGRLLLDSGADIDGGNNEGQTPLHWAVENGRTEMVEFLLSRGANMDAKDGDSMTPLHRAVIRGYDTIVAILLRRGAYPAARAKDGSSPIESALKGGYVRIARLLRLAGAGMENREDVVAFVQNQLWLRGYGISDVDGVVGPNTVAAIRAYQDHAGLVADGAVTDALVDHLSSSGEIEPYLSGDGRTVTNIFVSWYDLAYEYGWDPGFLWSRGEFVEEGERRTDRGFRGAVKYTGHVRFGDLEIDGGVWVLANGWVIEHRSKVILHPDQASPADN